VDRNSRKRRAANLSLGYNVLATALKLTAAVATGSVSLLSEAAHSATDIVASAMASLSIRASSQPADDDHPYGHGKMESVAGFGESILLFGVVGYIAIEAIQRLLRGGSEVQALDFGIGVMAASAATSFVVGRYVQRVGRQTESIALQSNGQHLLVDFWTSAGVLAALAATRLTGLDWIDSAVALAFAIWLGYGAWGLFRTAFDHLVDRSLPEEEVERIRAILDAQTGVISWHRLRTRIGGSIRFVDVHIVVPRELSVVDAHEVADAIEKAIKAEFGIAVANVHVDPFDPTKAQDGSTPSPDMNAIR